MADKYVLRITVGPGYDLADHVEVPVNTAKPTKINTPLIDAELNVRIQNYKGLPKNSPNTSPYFSQEPHARNQDTYSIALRLTPKKPADGEDKEAKGITGNDLQFGNDFDHPIRDRLPPGFSYAMRIVKWWIDPGLDGDPYADSPYLFGPALSSFNSISNGPGTYDESKGGLVIDEGGDDAGLKIREEIGAPLDGKARMKWALNQDSKEKWIWEYGRTYAMDLYNGYIDFSELALKLPGYALPIMKYWDGQGLRKKRSHQLRYVLRNKTTKEVYLVILFTIYLREDINEDGTLKPEALEQYAKTGKTIHESHPAARGDQLDGAADDAEFDGEAALETARKHLSEVNLTSSQEKKESDTNDDDVD